MSGPTAPDAKLLSREELLRRYGRPRHQRVVFTNGCFDLLHRGHVAYLDAARALGDVLVVGVNTDASVRRLKGAGRPLLPEGDRTYVLAGLACVDAVTLFEEDTPRELVAALLPDVLVKGGDYPLASIVGRKEVEGAGGAVVVIPYVKGVSTTGLIERIRSGR
ncbi:MAG: D-glycero-beta-D-manno-heptose 1-phosphate adenylyltransferase [Gemmatimonadetes bacterium]|nr:D-glycero-beta-D-manno-heptose 1-phosphate adenylyltransferase [Gemmatimonadota bacterium]